MVGKKCAVRGFCAVAFASAGNIDGNFYGAAYFSKVFTKKKGISPLEYRKSIDKK